MQIGYYSNREEYTKDKSVQHLLGAFLFVKNATNSVKILDNTPRIAYNIIKDKEQNKRRKSK